MNSIIHPPVLKVNTLQRQAILGLFPLLSGICFLVAIVFVPQALRGNADFRQFYSGGYILRAGLRHSFYDQTVQKDVEDRIVSPSSQLLPIDHPAYEYLFFVPLSFFSYRTAYLLWSSVNLLLLILCGIRIARFLDPWLAFALTAGFAPAWAILIHGQDSIWLLVVLFLCLQSGDGLKSGLFLGLGAFRFHLIIPIAFAYLLWKRWRFLFGALVTSGLLAIVSISLVGIRGSLTYIKTAASSTEVRKGLPVNLYGLCQVVTGRNHPELAIVMACIGGLITFWYVSRRNPSLAMAVLIIPLTSYYLMLHDLVVLLLPMAFMLRRSWGAVAQYLLCICGFFPPGAWIAALASIPMLWRCDTFADKAFFRGKALP